MSQRSIRHATFVIERNFDAPPARVFNAFADRAAKDRWFQGPEGWERGERQFDFRVGGRERSSGGPKGGPVHTFNACYQDIVPNERIVYTYDMHFDDKRTSVSLTTVELKPAGSGTRMVFTEQGVFLNGHGDAEERERGSRWLMDKLGDSLREPAQA